MKSSALIDRCSGGATEGSARLSQSRGAYLCNLPQASAGQSPTVLGAMGRACKLQERDASGRQWQLKASDQNAPGLEDFATFDEARSPGVPVTAAQTSQPPFSLPLTRTRRQQGLISRRLKYAFALPGSVY